MSRLFTSGSQSIGASTLASVLPMNIQGWFYLGLTGLISCSPRDSQESSPIPQFKTLILWNSAFFMAQLTWLPQQPSGKESTYNTGDAVSGRSGSGRSLGGGNDNPLQHYCLENSMARGAWWATVYRVTNNWKQLSTHTHTHTHTHTCALVSYHRYEMVGPVIPKFFIFKKGMLSNTTQSCYENQIRQDM